MHCATVFFSHCVTMGWAHRYYLCEASDWALTDLVEGPEIVDIGRAFVLLPEWLCSLFRLTKRTISGYITGREEFFGRWFTIGYVVRRPTRLFVARKEIM